jgi:cytidylate kinase
MTAITISREFGSEGTRIATQVAQALGYHVADKAIMERILRQYGLNLFVDDVDGALPGFWIFFDQQLQETTEMLDQALKALAQHGNVVIIGRGGYAALRGLADVLNIRIQAPRALRVQRVAEREGISTREAEARVAEGDRARTGFLERAYKMRADDPKAFDLVVDTGNLSPAEATRVIVEATNGISQRAPDDRPRASGFEVSKTLARVVSDALGCGAEYHP